MKTFYNDEGRLVMNVIIPERFKQSGFIRDVLETGREFVVDVETGKLLIQRPASKLNIYYEYFDENTGETLQKKISTDLPTALIQLEDMINVGRIGVLNISVNGKIVFYQKLVNFVSQKVISQAYSKYVF